MGRRELILRELGLMPLWVPRGQTAKPAAGGPEGERAAQAGSSEEPVASRTSEDRAATIARMDWPALSEAVRSCAACPLHAARKQAVLGVGDQNADWLFVGEGPGADEDARGEPFVGQAGRLLDNMLAAIGLKRGRDVYIANMVKCRPPGNRVPEPQEAAQCEPFLLRQIELIRPRLIVALGKTAASNLLRTHASTGQSARAASRFSRHAGAGHLPSGVPVAQSCPTKPKSWEDLCMAVDTMRAIESERQPPPDLTAASHRRLSERGERT